MNRRAVVGFDRRLDLEWLDATAGQVASGADTNAVRAYLDRLLDGTVAGGVSRGARDKTVTVLLRIWSQVPEQSRPLRDRALALLPHLSPDARLAAHWAMTTAAYPFFADVTGICGRLVALQSEITLTQLYQRVNETWGARSTTERAARRILRSLVQWDVLEDTTEKGVYRASRPRVVPSEAAELLLEALLLDQGAAAIALPQLVGHAALFPFDIALTAHDLRAVPRFDVQRHGLDLDLVTLTAVVAQRPAQRPLW